MNGTKLYVGNLTYSVTAQQLRDLFGQYGEVADVRVIEGKGFGFVDMANKEDADKAREALNESQFEGRAIRVDEARPQTERPRNKGPRRR
ncbi:MAG: RNA recognition motif domain-containing protein [Syntrophorhabdaceae bacterium]